jgi:hypothetical protein
MKGTGQVTCIHNALPPKTAEFDAYKPLLLDLIKQAKHLDMPDNLEGSTHRRQTKRLYSEMPMAPTTGVIACK